MGRKQFKAESKRLLDLMINSIYTHREIFLRELISNASDALDKLYYRALTEHLSDISREDLGIDLVLDKEARTIVIRDNGIGMSKEDLENNLGVIARSGSRAFRQDMTEDKTEGDVDIIGQFGVGFYSAFMVSDKVTVESRAYGADEAWRWESEGADGYTIDPCEKAERGTAITLHIKPKTEEEDTDEYLEPYRIQGIVKKYSDYIRYPIRMDMERSRLKEGSDKEYESYTENVTLNSMVPLWRKNRSEITPEEYHQFYKEKFYDFENPARVIHSNTEGAATYNALLFIPARAPFNYYTREYEKGLQLYASGVLIMDKCADLLPDYFSFVKGLVDSQDLSLNISREMLQQDRQLKAIAQRLEKKISSTLLEMQEKDRESYDKMFEAFGMQLKYGVYDQYGVHKDKLKDFIEFYSSTTDELATFKEYVSRMRDDQKYIYYATGESKEKIAKMPQMDLFKEKGYEVLYCTDEIDEFALKILQNYDDKEFKSISDKDLGFEMSDEEKKAQEEKQEEAKDVLTAVKEALGDKVASVILSTRLKDHPVCFASGDGLSLEMEKVLKAQAEITGNKEVGAIKADKILELNGDHPFFAALKAAVDSDNKEKVSDYAQLLYDQALIIEGLPIDDPVAFSNRICNLMK